MKQHFYIFFLCFFFSAHSFTAHAQGKRQFYEAYVTTGDSCLASYNYYGAHQAYEKAYSYIQNTEIAFKIAEACKNYQNYIDAEKYYRIALAQDSVSYPFAKYYYAEMLKYQGKYKEAYVQYNQFYRLNRRIKAYEVQRARNEAKICKTLIPTVPNYENLQYKRITSPQVNTMYAEYSPIQYNDSLFFFGGVRAVDTIMADTAHVFSNYWHRLLIADLKDSVFTNVREVNDLNENGYHVSNITFNKKGDVAYFTKCKDYACKIYRASFDVKTLSFTNIKVLPNPINVEYTTNTTPSFATTPIGDVLFFASDRKGGSGKLDIWYSKISDNDKFENPVNLGKIVNTIGNDVTPFYDARDSLLYFSSENHVSLGGYDVFSTKVDWGAKTWTKPQNVGEPINSSHDDLYYSFSRDSLHAYWVSSRTESKKLIEKAFSNDIYTHPLVKRSIIRITDLVPIYLYFDNDYPDPRSYDTITDKDYLSLYQDYLNKKEEYLIEYTKHSPASRYEYDARNVETFFSDLTNEYERLFLFAELLEIILEDGQDIVIVFKGYASPLGNTRYNEIVAKKRISCIQNFFYEFNGGVLNQYTRNEPGSGKGSIIYAHEPIGETIMDDTFVTEDGEQISAISDRKQKWMSVYSPSAAYQRKIEIVAVNIEYADELFEKIQAEIQTTKKQIEEELNHNTDNEYEDFLEDTYEESEYHENIYSEQDVIRQK
ncbi:MAG: hypothetical protein M0R02_03550 [Bacteroidales bacterium]|nr:hypothetical protein [Bacteroidales bacterium]